MRSYSSAVLILTAALSGACRTTGRSTDNSAVSSFTIGKFTPKTGDPSWSALQVAMPRIDGDQREIDQDFALSDFQAGNVKKETLLVPQGSYTIALSYKDAKGALLYQVCKKGQDHVFVIDKPTFTADIALCKAGSGDTAGTTQIAATSNVTITPQFQDQTPVVGTNGISTVVPPVDNGPHTAYASYYLSLAPPETSCGVPEAQLETTDFVALNVQQTPGSYGDRLTRPLTDPATFGTYANGGNCGRWVEVTVAKVCKGFANSGSNAQTVCPDASLTTTSISGATVNLLVADGCHDGNAWCRDDRYHLSLHDAALAHFRQNGSTLDLTPQWSNPQVSWRFIKAPLYKDDIKLAFGQDWPTQGPWPLVITHLENGLHGVELKVQGSWTKAVMRGDSGQSYLLPSTADKPFQMRLYDAAEQLIQGGRIYTFNGPPACVSLDGDICRDRFTPMPYTVAAP